MKGIVSYHIVAPGELWVRPHNGTLRRATPAEEINLLNQAPDIALQICWHPDKAGQSKPL